MSISITIILDSRRIKKNSTCPLKLRVTCERVTEYYQTIFELPKSEYAKLNASHIGAALRKVRDQIESIEMAAKKAAENIDPFEFREFSTEFILNHPLFKQRKIKQQPHPQAVDTFDFSPFYKKIPLLKEVIPNPRPDAISSTYLSYIRMLLKEGRIGTAIGYHASYVSLKKFRGDVRFAEITPSWLREYENDLLSKDISKTTVGIYLRSLRTVFNEAIEARIIKREKCYPFGKRKYMIPASRKNKKALTLGDVEKIYHYNCTPGLENEQKAKDYWMFSYLANGMNIKDIALLKYKNIDGEFLVFERSKTQKSLRSDPKLITVFITEDMRHILERHGNKEKSPNNYIFPILEPGLSPLRQYELIQLLVSLINEWMRKIMKSLGINKKASTYVARHTFSTVLKRSGASTEYIQEALGHTDLKTTEDYLDSFENDMKKEYAGRLIVFLKER
ncbi:MAG TPA: site-specific integrase [Chitinophagaceae bacterium]|nr:site-specific integrase [Chitinophagaceae bacterium]